MKKVKVNYIAFFHTQTYYYYAVERKLEYAQQLIGQLSSKSADLNWKVEDAGKDVGSLKCGFGTLKDDVTVLESARSAVTDAGTALDQHVDESASELSALMNAVEEKKETVNNVKDFTHPCGGSGWEQVEYLDFREGETPCPTSDSVIGQTMYPERPYTCGIDSDMFSRGCGILTIPVRGREYSKVCGRIRAYQFGTPDGFFLFHGASSDSINEPYLTGISLTHGASLQTGTSGEPATHIWSFVLGLTQFPSNPNVQSRRCPCDGGIDPPEFVGEDYFCEAAIESDVQQSNQFDNTFHFRNVLWDGKGCGDDSNCCSRIKHPYFVKQLEVSTTDDIDLRLCLFNGITRENVAIELIEVYIQ